MKDGLKDKYRQAIIDILSQCEQVEKVVLFGSRAMGTFTITSDVDIVLFGDKLTLTDQGNLAEQIEELTMPQSADLLLYRSIESKELLKHIREYGVQWWPEKNEQRCWEMENKPFIFSECATEVRDKVQPEGANGARYIGLEHIEQGTLHLNSFGSANDVSSTKSKFSKGDILFGKLRPYFRKVVRAPFDGVCSTDIWVVRSTNGIDQGFLYYWMASQEFVDFSMQGSEGTKMPRAKWNHVSRHQVPFFTEDEQKAIAHILGSLDDKIELNRRMNKTLEAMAQALFKSWFIDFDPVLDNAILAGNPIPDELEERAEVRRAILAQNQSDECSVMNDELKNNSALRPHNSSFHHLFPSEFEPTEEMGPACAKQGAAGRWIPKGWGVATLDDLVDLIGGGTPKTSKEEYWNGGIPWFSVVDAPNTSDVFVIDTEKNVTELGVEKSSTKILPIGTTIISARGTVGKCAMVGEPMAMNQSCYGVRGKKDISDSFVYYAIREKVADLQRGGHGSVFNTITRDTFKTIKIAFGEPELTGKLDDRIKPSFDRILANRFCSKTLSKTRDTLLPQLLSGEIRTCLRATHRQIPEAEKLVEETEQIMRDEL